MEINAKTAMNTANSEVLTRKYRNIFLVQNRDFWHTCPFNHDKQKDLVLTFDFGLYNEIKPLGGMVDFIDHLLDTNTMERYNYEMYDFFAKWHYDKDGDDIFSYKGIKVGNAFRIEIWNDITYYSRIFISLIAIKNIKYEKIFIGLEDKNIFDFMRKLNIEVAAWSKKGTIVKNEYYFPIFRWNSEALYGSGFKKKLYHFALNIVEIIYRVIGSMTLSKSKRDNNIYVQDYHPTKKIIERLKQDPGINLILERAGFREIIKGRSLPGWRYSFKHKILAKRILEKFKTRKYKRWDVDGVNVSDSIYVLIIDRISRAIPYYLCFVDSIVKCFSKRKLSLAIAITNLASKNCLIMNYCEKNNIPSYLIINGLLVSAFLDESKCATWINSYGESIKNNYFREMDNIVCLGDPRMDDYINNVQSRTINIDVPTIVVGTSGYNNCDLNSYVAVEFDFINDIMGAFKKVIDKGRKMMIIIKVRANGYIGQYTSFIKEYYPDLEVELVDRIPFRQALSRCDFYISIYSQTVFEASCLGIPVLYYKKDTEMNYPPFDGKSELVTAQSISDLVEKIELFYKQDPIYGAFKDKKIMEQYIGPLDGKNLERNLSFIYSLIGRN